MEYETKYRGNKYKYIYSEDSNSVSIYVNDKHWGSPQGERFIRALIDDINKLKYALETVESAYWDK